MFTSDQDRNPAVVIREQVRDWEWEWGGRRRRRGYGEGCWGEQRSSESRDLIHGADVATGWDGARVGSPSPVLRAGYTEQGFCIPCLPPAPLPRVHGIS